MSVIRKITGCMKNKTLLPTIYLSARSRMPVWYVRNDFLRKRLLFNRVYTSCEKRYQQKLAAFDFEESKEKEIPKTIWISWLQGLENAPELVKVCYKSVCENMKGYQINFISEKNMSEFVDIPDFILKKWKNGIIPHPHFSDYLRTALLTQRGGVWIDSTVLCTGYVDFNDICNGSGLFAYTDRFGMRYGGCISSWLIAANKDSRIMHAVKYLLDDYWAHTNFLANYFIYHILFSLAAKRFLDEWATVPVFTNDVPHILSGEITQPYTEKRFNQIRQMSNIHKLSRHIDVDSIPKESFYDVLINKKQGI